MRNNDQRHRRHATDREKRCNSLISKMIGAAKADGACLLCNSSEHNLPQCEVLQKSAEDDIEALLKSYSFVVHNACPEAGDAISTHEFIDTLIATVTTASCSLTLR